MFAGGYWQNILISTFLTKLLFRIERVANFLRIFLITKERNLLLILFEKLTESCFVFEILRNFINVFVCKASMNVGLLKKSVFNFKIAQKKPKKFLLDKNAEIAELYGYKNLCASFSFHIEDPSQKN